MTRINTTLTTSGNSVAVRLPKELLKMSGLQHNVRLEAKKGKIIISKSDDPREGWGERMDALLQAGESPVENLADMDSATNDGLDNEPWEGPSYEDWLKSNGKFS